MGETKERVAAVTSADAICYTIRPEWGWAHIFVRHGIGETGAGNPRGWVNLAILSDYGTYGYCWTHIGSEPWQQFLAGLSFDYAMNKLAGSHFLVPMDLDSARAKAKRLAVEYRRDGAMTKDEARELYDAADDCWEASSFLRDLDEHSGGVAYRFELWDSRWQEPSAQSKGFWREIWPHFIAALAHPNQEPQP